jgi:hypothetical protein
VAGSCEYGGEPSGSCATKLVNSVTIVTRLRDGVTSQQGRIYLFTTTSIPNCGPPSLLFNGYRRLFPGGVKQPGHEAKHSLPCNAEASTACNYISTLPYVCNAWRLVKHQGELYIYFIH